MKDEKALDDKLFSLADDVECAVSEQETAINALLAFCDAIEKTFDLESNKPLDANRAAAFALAATTCLPRHMAVLELAVDRLRQGCNKLAVSANSLYSLRVQLKGGEKRE